MNKYSFKLLGALGATALTVLTLQSGETVQAAQNHNIVNTQSQKYALTAKVIGDNNALLADQKIEVFDITTSRQLVDTKNTDANGLISFSLLEGHNYSFAVNGVTQPNTIRYSGTAAHDVVLHAQKSGTITPHYNGAPITIGVFNEEAEPLQGQQVTLKDHAGNIIENVNTDSAGHAVFKNKLLAGEYYNYEVSGQTGTVFAGQSRNSFIDSNKLAQKTATFTVNVLGKANNLLMAGQKVTMFDITESRQKVAEAKTDKSGQAKFEILPGRNYAFAINDVNQGYTVRGASTEAKSTSFFIQGAGQATPHYDGKPISVKIVNEDGEAISDQTVTLKDKQGHVIATAKSDKQGVVTFKDKLLQGVMYDFEVNGHKNLAYFAFSGESRTVALATNQIKKATPATTYHSVYTPSQNYHNPFTNNVFQQAETPLHAVVFVGILYNNPHYKVALWNTKGEVTGYISTNSAWKVFATRTINGLKMYRLGTQNQWVPAKYVSHLFK